MEINENKEINWEPEHIRDGRFGEWLKEIKDWAISRDRYWGTPLPVWRAEDGETICVGGREELEKLTGEKVTNLHKHIVDHLVITKDGKEFHHRSPKLFWF